MTERWTYINDKWVPEAAAKIHVYDSHFMYGDAVFEMHRTFRHQHFLLDEHINRLWTSMKWAQIPITKSKDEIHRLCDEAIKRNPFPNDEEYRFMINVSRGPLEMYREVFELDDGARWDEPTWIINAWPLSKSTAAMAHFYDEPANAIVTKQRQIPSQYLEAKVKNRSRMHYRMANLEMKGRGPKAVPLLLDDQGLVSESSGANFIMVKDDKLIVPELRNMLRGCSMMYILDVIVSQLNDYGGMHLDVIEKNFEPYDILEADEAMFTGTFVNLLPCNKLNDVRFGVPDDQLNEYAMGPITAAIARMWSWNVTQDLNFHFPQQIKDWAKREENG